MIVHCGKGPMIEGSRITVYDVLAETQAGIPPQQLAEEWHLRVEQIEEALRYIEEHRAEVESAWARIRARHARGNPPEIEARVAAAKMKVAAYKQAKLAAMESRGNGHARSVE